jgi:hypothetical protein
MDTARQPRRLIGTVSALVLAVVLSLVAMPSAQAAPPTRTVFEAEEFVIPAGFGCSFDVVVSPPDPPPTVTVTEFSDGRVMRFFNGYPIMTNAETGESIVHHSRYQAMETYDALTNQVHGLSDGTVFAWFFPGDVGPSGEIIGDGGALLSLTGHIEYTLDVDTFVTTSFELDGQVNADLCALLSPS